MGFQKWLRKVVIGGGKGGPKDLAMQWTKALWCAKLWQTPRWLGMEIWQWPTDLLIMQELIYELKPKVILETGTAHGGSAIFYSSMLRLLGGGRVISVDIEKNDAVHKKVLEHPFGSDVTLITGDSKAPEILDQVREALAGETEILVVLDSDHSYAHVLGELRVYKDFVPLNGYLVVFDTICKALGDVPGLADWREDNPLRSVEEFLAETPEFELDKSREKLLVSFAPSGFLRRIR